MLAYRMDLRNLQVYACISLTGVHNARMVAQMHKHERPGCRTTPGVALGVADRVWSIGDLLDTVLAIEPNQPVRTARKFTVIKGGKE